MRDVIDTGVHAKGRDLVTSNALIAVVDDDPVYSEMMKTFLDDEGFATILIADAATAVDTIDKAQPALALLDVRMDSVESGVHVLNALRQRPGTSGLPVIVCSADQQFLGNRADYLRSQNATSIAKPFDLDRLLALIHESLTPGG